jgi:hypothetical protein
MESKNLPIPVELPCELKELSRRINLWRRDPSRGRRMPEFLWALAVHLARQHSVHRVARCLHLDYYSLKRRMQGAAETACAEANPTFIELPAFSSGGMPECNIEVEHPRGARMRIHVKGTALPDLASITRAFFGNKR